MMRVPDVRATIDWYTSIGFVLDGAHDDDGVVDWARISFGKTSLMLIPSREARNEREVIFWFKTSRVDDLYQLLRQRQLERAAAVLAGAPAAFPEARFTADLHDAFYGEREFTIVDLNGYELVFSQTVKT
jgi:catechol 2,3-dioxygenase-like lactoylglutathione lyase family enzyme